MRHLKAGYKLGRNAPHRRSMYRNLAMALIRHERIITTVEKAKAVRPFIEKLITKAKKGTLHARRLVVADLGATADAEVAPGAAKDKDADHRTIVQKLFEDIGPRFADRPGGYTRIIKRHERRLGDGGHTAYLELLKAGEKKHRARETAAPRVEPEQPAAESTTTPASQPTAETPQATPPAETASSQTPPEAPTT